VPHRIALCIAAALLLVTSQRAIAAEPKTGPWDFERILSTPTPIKILSQDGNLRAIEYPSEPYRGKPSTVFAYYAVPEGKPGEKFPAMLLVHGGGGKAFAEWAKLWADRGYAALAMDLAGCGADGTRLPAGGPPQDDGAKFFAIEKEPLTDTWPYQAVAAVLRGHALLKEQPEVDAERIGITGISWGGYLTSIVSGIDPQLKVAVPVYGCGFLSDNSAWRESGIFDKLSPAARDKWVGTFDPSVYLPGVSMPILFVNGTNDFAYPLDSYQKSYELVKSPRTLCVTVNMPHSHPDGWAPKEIGAFVDSVLKDARPFARLTELHSDGKTASAKYESEVPLAKAALHYSTDRGRWQDRKWTTEPAEIDSSKHTISVRLPKARPLAAFITAVDDRGLTVSTPHVELVENEKAQPQ